MLFEVSAAQISGLDSTSFVELLRRLLLAECQTCAIPLRAAQVPLQINVADGGEDARVEWSDGVEATDYFPKRYCAFQSKARGLTEAYIANEVAPLKKGVRRVNPAVSDVLKNRGAYVVFCSKPYGSQKLGKLRTAIRSAIKEAGRDPLRATIDVYDANAIRDWVNGYPAVALWVRSQHSDTIIDGFLTHEGWGKSDDIAGVPWSDDDVARFRPANYFPKGASPAGAAKTGALTFKEVREAIATHLAQDKAIVRVSGASGFGKTRFVYEVLNKTAQLADTVDRISVVFADYDVVQEDAVKLALRTAQEGAPTILVVDECNDEAHRKLAEQVRREGARLRLITIDIESSVSQSKDTLSLELAPASDALVGAIAKAVEPKISDANRRLVEELARGFPRMAVLAARHDGDGRATMMSVGEVVDRVIWGGRKKDADAATALESLALFDWVGISSSASAQGTFVAREIAEQSLDRFAEHILGFKKRGIVAQRGGYVRLEPIPLATLLATRRLDLLRDGRLGEVFIAADPLLQGSLLRRMRWLDNTRQAKAFAASMLEAKQLGNLAAISSEAGAQALSKLVHVDPDGVMRMLQRVTRDLKIADLQRIRAGRRNLVWTLERLVFRKESFYDAARLLRRLGAAETEPRISNSASGLFAGLYKLHLSGTEAGLEDRLLILDEGLASAVEAERDLCVAALERMLETGHFSRGGGHESIGSAAPLKDWQPTTWDEQFGFYRAALQRLAILVSSGGPYASRAKDALGGHIRGLLRALPFEDVEAMIREVGGNEVWPKALQQLNQFLYFDREKTMGDLPDKVRALYDDLLPSDPVDLVEVYTIGWQGDFHEPGAIYSRKPRTNKHDFPMRQAERLAKVVIKTKSDVDRALKRFVAGDHKTIGAFSRQLAISSSDPLALFNRALGCLGSDDKPNRAFFSAFISGAETRDAGAARACIKLALRHEKLKADPISWIGSGTLEPSDIDLAASLLRAGDIEPWSSAVLSYGRGMDHLNFAQIEPLLSALAEKGREGYFVIFDILTMYYYDGREMTPDAIEWVTQVLLRDDLVKCERGGDNDYDFEVIIKRLAKHGALTRTFCDALVKQLLVQCEDTSSYNVEGARTVRAVLKLLIEVQPVSVWKGVSRLLTHRHRVVRHKIQDIVESLSDSHLAPGLLHQLPQSLTWAWARKSPTKRASIVMSWLPIATREEGGPWLWTPALEQFIGEFGQIPAVLSQLSLRLRLTSWVGSAAHSLERLLALVESWSSHPDRAVRAWAVERADGLRDEIAKTRAEDEEDEVRFD